MRTILCPLCEADQTRSVNHRQVRGLAVTTVLCLGCGLVYHNPVLEDADRQGCEVSFQGWHTEAAPTPRHLRKLEQRWERQWSLMQRVFQPGSRVLEVGSGLGFGAGRLQGRGAQVLGVEPDPGQAAYARSHWGLTILAERFEEVDLDGQTFDLIVSSHVIEHFPEPLAFLRKVRTLAGPGTWLFLETPNILAPKVGPRRVFSLAHNFYFAPQTLAPLLLKAGWQVEHLRVWRRDSFQVLARPGSPRTSAPSPGSAREILHAIHRHRYEYYLKLLFFWRKLPWWQKNWMYTPDPHWERG
jgi:2-polyprenyl-3-methyl-5-hydroxy-6-metoxy-1,4-benzoquinol methylase